MSLLGKWFGFGRDEIFDEGVRAHDRGDYESAIDAFEEALSHSLDPGVVRLARTHLADSYTRLAEMLGRSGSWNQAATFLRKSVTLCPTYPDLHLRLAIALGKAGDLDGEEAALTETLRLNPNYSHALLIRASRTYSDGMREEGMGEVAKAMSLDPDLMVPAYQTFLDCHTTGMFDQATAALSALTESIVDDADVHARLADSFLRDRMFQEAANEYEVAIETSPGYADLRCKYGQVLLQLDRLDEAREQLEKAVEINPDYADGHAQLGICLKRLRRDSEARQSFKRAYALNPTHEIASMEISRLAPGT